MTRTTAVPTRPADHDARRRRSRAAQAAAAAGGLVSLNAVLVGTPELFAQSHAVRVVA